MDRSKPSTKDVGHSGARGKESARKTARRTFKAQGLSRLIPKILKDGLGRKGSLEADLALHWREVAGEELAAWTVPSRISYADRRMRRKGTLLLLVNLGHGRIEKVQLKQSHGINFASHRITVSDRAVGERVSSLETRRERRQNDDLDEALETLRESVAKREHRR